MPFGLPPAWSPGFALPDNVLDEGLERRGLVTKQMPRGTYDQYPTDPTGGYAVPQYVRDEGYGQGTFVTKWMPRGEAGPRVPQWIQRQPTVVAQKSLGRRENQVTIQRRSFSGLGGLSGEPPLPEPFEQYGQRAAAAILSRINRLAPGQRKQQLRAILDAIDPSLWNRTAEITRRYVAQGLHATEAFPRGLARALAAGIAAEMITAGQSRTAPQPRSLLGLGCYGCDAALGALPTSFSQTVTNMLAPKVSTAPKTVHVGPFAFPADQKEKYVVSYSVAGLQAMPAAQKSYIRDMLIKGAGDSGPWHPFVPKMKWIDGHMTYPALWKWIEALGLRTDQKLAREMLVINDPLDWSDSMGVTYDRIANQQISPILTFTHPVSGNDWGIFLVSPAMRQVTDARPAPPAANDKFYLYYRYIPTANWWHKLGRWVKHIPASIAAGEFAVGGAVKDTLEELGHLACQLAQNPNAVGAGAAAGMAATGNPGGASAGAAGAAIAQNVCGGAKVPQVPVAPASDNLLPLVLIGGGVLAATLLLTRKKGSP